MDQASLGVCVHRLYSLHRLWTPHSWRFKKTERLRVSTCTPSSSVCTNYTLAIWSRMLSRLCLQTMKVNTVLPKTFSFILIFSHLQTCPLQHTHIYARKHILCLLRVAPTMPCIRSSSSIIYLYLELHVQVKWCLKHWVILWTPQHRQSFGTLDIKERMEDMQLIMPVCCSCTAPILSSSQTTFISSFLVKAV